MDRDSIAEDAEEAVITSEQINKIAAAGAKAQLELQPAIKDAVNPAFRSKYADFAAIREAARVYAKHGIAAWQEVTRTDGGVSVLTRLTHASGQWMELGPLTVPVAKPDAHGVGSATTYAKRYALSAALGISADDDDDGNAASQPNGASAKPEAKPATGPEPAGFDDWWADMEAAGDEGWAKVSSAFNAAKPEYRSHLTKHHGAGWDALKAKAARVKASA